MLEGIGTIWLRGQAALPAFTAGELVFFFAALGKCQCVPRPICA
jgi:hypothetical protein